VNAELSYLSALLRALAATGPPPEPSSYGIGWDRVSPPLLGHRLMIPMFAPLVQKSATAPESLKEELQSLSRSFRLRSGLLLRELYRIISPLEEAGIQPVVLKGPALAQTVYDPPLARYFTDLDVLVRREDCDAACEILRRLGYGPTRGAMHPQYYERYHFHRSLENSAGVLVEVHWDLSRRNDYVRFDVDAFRARACILETTPVPIRIPAASDQLLLVAKQELDGGFSDLRRVVDGAFLIRAGAASDPSLAERARNQNLAGALWVLLLLVRELTAITAPDPLEAGVRPASLVETCIKSLDLPGKTLSRYTFRRAGLVHLLRWLCAPSFRALQREVWSFVLPRRELLLQLGHDPDNLPGPARRFWLGARRAWSLVKVCCYQAYRLARNG